MPNFESLILHTRTMNEHAYGSGNSAASLALRWNRIANSHENNHYTDFYSANQCTALHTCTCTLVRQVFASSAVQSLVSGTKITLFFQVSI